MMIARRCCCSAISVLFQKTRPRSVLVSHKQKNSSLLSSIDRSHFFVFIFFFFFERFFFVSKPRRLLCCKSQSSFLQFFSRETSSKDALFCHVCLFATPKKENFSSENLSTWSPLLSTGSHASKISGNVFCGILFCTKTLNPKTLLKGVLFNTRTRTVSPKRNVFG